MTRPRLTTGELAALGRKTCGEAWPEIIREATGMNRRTLQRWHAMADIEPDMEIGQSPGLRDEMADGLQSLGFALGALGEQIRRGPA